MVLFPKPKSPVGPQEQQEHNIVLSVPYLGDFSQALARNVKRFGVTVVFKSTVYLLIVTRGNYFFIAVFDPVPGNYWRQVTIGN